MKGNGRVGERGREREREREMREEGKKRRFEDGRGGGSKKGTSAGIN